MLIPSKEKAVELINSSIPYSDQIKNWDLSTNEKAVRFDWRGTRFRVGLDFCEVDEVGSGVLMGSDKAILLRYILKSNLGQIL